MILTIYKDRLKVSLVMVLWPVLSSNGTLEPDSITPTAHCVLWQKCQGMAPRQSTCRCRSQGSIKWQLVESLEQRGKRTEKLIPFSPKLYHLTSTIFSIFCEEAWLISVENYRFCQKSLMQEWEFYHENPWSVPIPPQGHHVDRCKNLTPIKTCACSVTNTICLD